MFIFQIQNYICHYLAWLLRMKRPKHDLRWHSIHHRLSSSTINQTKHFNNHIDVHYSKGSVPIVSNNCIKIKNPRLRLSVDRERQRSNTKSKMSVSLVPTVSQAPDDPHSSTESHSSETNLIYSELHAIVSQLTMITDHIYQQERLENESQDWKFVAMVIDRLCLFVFLFFTTIFTTLIFISASHLYTSR